MRAFTESHHGVSCGGKALTRLREEVFQQHSVSVAGINFQACSFNHSDISPFKWNQQFSGTSVDSPERLCSVL